MIALLARRGLPVDAAALERDWSLPYAINPSVELAWLQVYATPGPDTELYRLGEALVRLADQLSQYRCRYACRYRRACPVRQAFAYLGGRAARCC